jgi:polyketide biosynthesis acyl carrier protein
MNDRATVARVVTEAVTEIVPTVDPAEVVGHRHLRDLGADSVDRVEIILAVLDRLGVGEPLSSFSDLPHVEALVDFLHERGAS